MTTNQQQKWNFESANIGGINPNFVMQKTENLTELTEKLHVSAYPEKVELMKRSIMLTTVMAANNQLSTPEFAEAYGEHEEEPFTPLMWAYDLLSICGDFVAEDNRLNKLQAEAKKKASSKKHEGGK